MKPDPKLVKSGNWHDFRDGFPGRVAEGGSVYFILCFKEVESVSNFLNFGYSTSHDELVRTLSLECPNLGPGEAVFITIPQDGGRINVKLSSPPYARRFQLCRNAPTPEQRDSLNSLLASCDRCSRIQLPRGISSNPSSIPASRLMRRASSKPSSILTQIRRSPRTSYLTSSG